MTILYEAFVTELLRSSKLNGGRTVAVAEAKTTLARVCEVTLTAEPFRVVNWF